jgi:hypothetical protein
MTENQRKADDIFAAFQTSEIDESQAVKMLVELGCDVDDAQEIISNLKGEGDLKEIKDTTKISER